LEYRNSDLRKTLLVAVTFHIFQNMRTIFRQIGIIRKIHPTGDKVQLIALKGEARKE